MDGLIPPVEARALGIGHGGQTLVSNIGFALARGEVLCLLGPNGVGKTTLFRSLLGLIPALSGQILLDGRPLSRLSRAEVATRLAHVPQALVTPFAYSALDIVLMGAAVHLGAFARPGPAETARAHAALETLGIGDLAGADIARLSGGQRQLVLIARAIAQGAGTIMMDEPTASLDFANRILVAQAIRRLASRGTAVILSTHDPDQAAALGDRALLLGRGGVIAAGPTATTMTAANLSQLYGIAIRREVGAGGRLHFTADDSAP